MIVEAEYAGMAFAADQLSSTAADRARRRSAAAVHPSWQLKGQLRPLLVGSEAKNVTAYPSLPEPPHRAGASANGGHLQMSTTARAGVSRARPMK